MIINYFKIAWRNLLRQRIFSLINIFGLSIGLACFLLLASYVKFERSYDSFQEDSDRLFRVSQQFRGQEYSAWAGGAVAPMLRKEFEDQLESVVSVIGINTYLKTTEGLQPGESFREDYFYYAEPGFEQIAGLEILQGSLNGFFEEPFGLVLTETKAKKYFGEESPIGKILLATGDVAFEVKAVIADLPENTHMKFDFLSSVATFKNLNEFPQNADFGSFWWPQTYTYVKVKEGLDPNEISKKIPEINANYRNPEEAKNYTYFLQPIQSIHLTEDFSGDWSVGINSQTLLIFLSIGVFVLLLACINFINLATARAVHRMKEIGVRKVNGAKRGELIFQFLAESFLLNGIALIIGILLVYLFLPLFSKILSLELPFDLFQDENLLGLVVLVWVTTSLLAGIFPAFYLSGLKPDLILKQSSFPGGKVLIRKSLVIFQFSLSALLVFCATVAYMQHRFLQESEMGFDEEGLVTVKLGNVAKANLENIKQEMKKISSVQSVNSISTPPGLGGGWKPSVAYDGMQEDADFSVFVQYVDEEYFRNLGVSLKFGREFSPDYQDQGELTEMMRDRFPKVENLGIIINESAAKWIAQTHSEPLGVGLRVFTEENGLLFSDYSGKIIGVVQDYHAQDLRNSIKPTIFLPAQNAAADASNVLLVRLERDFGQGEILQLKNAWNEIVPGLPFDYDVLESSLALSYAQEARTGNLLGAFAWLTLLISCMGLLGLSIFTAESKRKEIGVRKVLGASVNGIVLQLSREFLSPILMALILALPIGFYLMNQWLQQFANKLSISVWYFVLTALISLLFAWITVSWQSWRSAIANPVESIKTE
ncbi:putative ABC transport system permease protein [Algoriphagus hitonicola]|uniref:Putative ABC transport system permease protein n=1 Tax=Algoriphagus hitonicola TaxID=435880 RepID=A0A1I2P914_9BACT|nr:FtsX-like permease family protein [Algoriphagus hitonicola]SFG09941.1 putative ABC transport system permease protein [Algoriphagus hitonicola]